MIDLLLQIDFTNLTSPQEFTSALATIISFIMLTTSYAGIRLRSPAVLIMWALSISVLILTFITALEFLWFWIMVMLLSLVISVAASVQYLL